MKKIKLKYLLYLLLIIFFILSIISFKYQIQDYSIINNNTGSNNDNYYDSNADNMTLDENTYNINLFKQVTVKRVVDGDTIVVIMDNTEYKVRLIGVNSPESTTKIEEYGKEASNYTTDMLTEKTVYLEKDVSETDKYGRLLRYVWLEIPTNFTESEIKEKMFNSILVLNGYAETATYPPDVKYVDYFKNFANIARENNVGLWKTK